MAIYATPFYAYRYLAIIQKCIVLIAHTNTMQRIS
ncbi:hypothetical protein Cassandra_0143 [Pseudomonas phage Cassandra]|nr:hypothetical protein Cassandra_0143 [Pseudomonas phage Cassandra]WPK39340.1 hypothetical protein Deiofobo_0143 [Pseudomonas phage Deifobo]WPK39852.1 hypothetical protein ETTORE_0143 [Pseudomonas phage Ettore]WPK40373.1 hypothetical protein Paride_0143 [Pseudomonas phage Paride]